MTKSLSFRISESQRRRIPVFALILMLTIISTPLTAMPASAAQIQTYAYVSVSPNPVQVGQKVLVAAWITPPPPINENSAITFFHDYCFVIVKPNGITYTKTIADSDSAGSTYFMYTPDQTGIYTIKLTWAGDETHRTVESPNSTFIVQQQPTPSYPDNPLPTGYWQRPISAENRLWSSISGDWLFAFGQGLEYDGSGSSFNPDSRAPNSAHILWTASAGSGGLIGGSVFGSAFMYQAALPITMFGRAYYTAMGCLICDDLRTGKELWKVPASGVPVGLPFVSASSPGRAGYWASGGVWVLGPTAYTLYDLDTGAVKRTMTPLLYPSPLGYPWIALEVIPNSYQEYAYLSPIQPMGHNTLTQIVKWDLSRATAVGGNWSSNVVWNVNVTLTQPDNTLFINILNGVVLASGFTQKFGYNSTTGALMWNVTTPYNMPDGRTTGYDKEYMAGADMKWHAFDIQTGQEVWASDPAVYPWGAFWAYAAGCAYGTIYAGSYDGHMYCFNATNGNTVWTFFSGNDTTTNSPYGTWPMWGNPAVADGKVYVSTTEHTPTEPIIRGFRLYCLNAFNGTKIWDIAGSFGSCAVGEGTLLASNVYDGLLYAFDKGQTTTTVTATDIAQPLGTPVLIKGTVTDQSPAQPGTPAIADEYMSAWMEYLHMQKAIPTNATGVPVRLTAIDSNGNSHDIGKVTSDTDGKYSVMWTPPIEGKYTIVANFDGSNSYFSSHDSTALGVTQSSGSPAPTPTPTASPTATPTASPTTTPSVAPSNGSGTGIGTEYYVAIAAVVIIVAIVAVAVLLRRRK